MPNRISSSQIFQFGQRSVAEAREREVNSAEKASTMRGITRASQDPQSWIKAASLKDDLQIGESISKNASLAQHSLNTTETLLAQVQENVQRAYEIAIAASGSDVIGSANRKAVLTDAENLFDSTIQTLNTRYANRTLLAGLKSQGNAFDKDGNYIGDGQDFEIEIARGLTVPVNINGARAILGEGVPEGENILDSMKSLIKGLREDDPTQIRDTLDRLQRGNAQVSLARSELAGRILQVERAISDFNSSSIELKDAISKVEDADAIKAFSELARDQAALKASMATTEKILHENPVDILFK